MKLGCIFKLIVIIIVILGTSFYVYEKYAKDYLSDRSEKVKELAAQKIEKMILDFTAKEIENPLKEKFTKMFEDIENKKTEFSEKKFEEIISNFNNIIKKNTRQRISLYSK